MARHVMKVPDVGEGVVEVELMEWHVAVGDTVAEDQLLVELMSDKANVEITAPVSGEVLEINGDQYQRCLNFIRNSGGPDAPRYMKGASE